MKTARWLGLKAMRRGLSSPQPTSRPTAAFACTAWHRGEKVNDCDQTTTILVEMRQAAAVFSADAQARMQDAAPPHCNHHLQVN